MSTAKRAFHVILLAACADEGVSIDNFLTERDSRDGMFQTFEKFDKSRKQFQILV